MVKPVAMRRAVTAVRNDYEVSERQACRALGLARSSAQYQSRKKDEPQLLEDMRQIAQERPRFGYRRIHVMLCRKGHQVNHKRVLRLYREQGLAVRRKTRRKLVAQVRMTQTRPEKPNQGWTMDFTLDALFNGDRFRTLNILDACTRECPAIVVERSLPATRVVRELDKIAAKRGYPEWLRVDNGPEFVSRVLDSWADENRVRLIFTRPGKPIDNADVESFNGKFRDECLNQNWFTSMEDARKKIEAWRIDYNTVRPHSSLNNLTPKQFTSTFGLTQRAA
jgi:putative transposase